MPQVVELPIRSRKASTTKNGKVPPRRRPNRAVRTREYLTPDEVERLLAAAGQRGRHGARDRTLLLLMFRHGLRVSEAISVRWDQFDLKAGLLHVRRLKHGVPSTHPLRGPELRALRQLRRDWPDGPYLFVSERGGPMTASNVRKLVARTGLRRPYRSPFTPTCCAIRPAISWPMRATTRAQSSTTSATGTSRTRSGTPNWRQIDSKGSGGTDSIPLEAAADRL